MREAGKLTLAEGAQAALPIVLGYVPIGIAYGVVAGQAHLTTAETVAMSLIVFAGSAQFIAVGMLAAGAGAWPIIVTTFLVNLRHLLMSAALSVPFRRIPRKLQAILAFWITDESFVVTSSALAGRQATVPFVAGLQITAYLAWAASSLVGAVLGNMASGIAGLGIDFALPAMFIALLVLQIKDWSSVLVAVLAGAVSLLLALYVPGNANVIVATLVAATAGVLLKR
ncbi:MAG: AzlC family ABC transporter permease [Bacillota bacterium]